MISNCGHDERNKYKGGQAGDQTGTEYAVIHWYSRPWLCVLRHPDPAVRAKIAELARAAAVNDCIGYDQGERTTFWEALQAANYNPGAIRTKCEGDCSSTTSSIIKAVGHLLNIQALKNVSYNLTTYIMRNALKTAGFDVFTSSKYLASDKYLLPGDILLNDDVHVAVNLDKGSLAEDNRDYLIKGDEGQSVKTMQMMLIALGYSCGASGVDGSFGADTEAAIKKFQAANNLEVDGSYGPATKAKLEALYKAHTTKPAWDNVYIDAMSGKDTHRWRITEVGKDASGNPLYKIVNKASGKALDVTEVIKPDTNVVAYKDSGTPGQKWLIRHIRDGLADYVEIIPSTNTKMYVSAEDNGQNSNNIKLWTALNNSKQRFFLRKESNGDYYIIHGFTSKVLRT